MSRLSKKDLVRDFESGGNHSRKRKSESKEEDVGNALFFVFRTETVGQGARVSGPLLKQKACDQLILRGGVEGPAGTANAVPLFTVVRIAVPLFKGRPYRRGERATPNARL